MSRFERRKKDVKQQIFNPFGRRPLRSNIVKSSIPNVTVSNNVVSQVKTDVQHKYITPSPSRTIDVKKEANPNQLDIITILQKHDSLLTKLLTRFNELEVNMIKQMNDLEKKVYGDMNIKYLSLEEKQNKLNVKPNNEMNSEMVNMKKEINTFKIKFQKQINDIVKDKIRLMESLEKKEEKKVEKKEIVENVKKELKQEKKKKKKNKIELTISDL
jgi:hypothetical protein